MPDRSKDWIAQAERDLEQAKASQAQDRHEWACFAAQQAAEKAVKALHLFLGQEAWGHVVARLLSELPAETPAGLENKAKVLDNFYIPTRYASGHPDGAPFEHYGLIQSNEAISIMPVRSLNSSVLVWPKAEAVHQAISSWVAEEAVRHPGVLRVGYFGSYARGDSGVGSDLDLIVILERSSDPFEKRNLDWNLNFLPVPSDLLVYTRKEWKQLLGRDTRFSRTLRKETVWVYELSAP